MSLSVTPSVSFRYRTAIGIDKAEKLMMTIAALETARDVKLADAKTPTRAGPKTEPLLAKRFRTQPDAVALSSVGKSSAV